MLCQFSFKNFMSYRKETTFDFQAAAIPEFENSLLKTEKASSLLPVSVIYGPNGGGKTNLLCALSCVISLVVSPIYNLNKTREKMVFQQNVSVLPFLFDKESRNEPTEFQIYFRASGNEYRYYIAVLNEEIIAESLNRRTIGGKKTALLFERTTDVIKLGSSISKKNINTSINPKMPFLSFLAINYNISHISIVQRWFEKCIIRNYASNRSEAVIMLSENDGFKTNFISALNDMGIDITGYRYDKESEQFRLKRTINDTDYELQFEKESDGTKKIFSALPLIMLALQEGRLIIVDELDAKLHPKLLKYLIFLFTNKDINKKGAQLIFTSHDLTTMRNDIFRRDEIWFSAMDETHNSEIYSLYDIRKEDGNKVNNTAAYDKQYLEGRYGADPYLKTMLNWEALV